MFFFYRRNINNSRYNIGINFSKNNINYYHRVGTPPLNPLIPIFKVQKGTYAFNMVNLIISYSYLFNKFNFNIIIDNMTPIKTMDYTENIQTEDYIDENTGKMGEDISSKDKLLVFTKLYIIITYTIK